jgi:hypothetical protein
MTKTRVCDILEEQQRQTGNIRIPTPPVVPQPPQPPPVVPHPVPSTIDDRGICSSYDKCLQEQNATELRDILTNKCGIKGLTKYHNKQNMCNMLKRHLEELQGIPSSKPASIRKGVSPAHVPVAPVIPSISPQEEEAICSSVDKCTSYPDTTTKLREILKNKCGLDLKPQHTRAQMCNILKNHLAKGVSPSVQPGVSPSAQPGVPLPRNASPVRRVSPPVQIAPVPSVSSSSGKYRDFAYFCENDTKITTAMIRNFLTEHKVPHGSRESKADLCKKIDALVNTQNVNIPSEFQMYYENSNTNFSKKCVNSKITEDQVRKMMSDAGVRNVSKMNKQKLCEELSKLVNEGKIQIPHDLKKFWNTPAESLHQSSSQQAERSRNVEYVPIAQPVQSTQSVQREEPRTPPRVAHIPTPPRAPSPPHVQKKSSPVRPQIEYTVQPGVITNSPTRSVSPLAQEANVIIEDAPFTLGGKAKQKPVETTSVETKCNPMYGAYCPPNHVCDLHGKDINDPQARGICKHSNAMRHRAQIKKINGQSVVTEYYPIHFEEDNISSQQVALQRDVDEVLTNVSANVKDSNLVKTILASLSMPNPNV